MEKGATTPFFSLHKYLKTRPFISVFFTLVVMVYPIQNLMYHIKSRFDFIHSKFKMDPSKHVWPFY